MRAGTFTSKSAAASRVAAALEETSRQVLRRPGEGAALVFVTGALREALPEVAAAIAQVGCPVPVLIAGGAGVSDPDQEIVDEPAATGIVWDVGRAEALALHVDSGDANVTREALSRTLEDRAARGEPTALLFTRGEHAPRDALAALANSRVTPSLFGGGTSGPHGSAVVLPGEAPRVSASTLLVLRGVRPPELRCSPACRLLTPFYDITEHQGPMLLELEGRPALELLRASAPSVDEELMLLALAPDASVPTQAGRPELLLRGISGVAPARGGVMLSEAPQPGTRVAVAAQSAHAARSDLEATSRELLRATRGSAPGFGIYLSSASRGVHLYQQRHVEARIIRQRFPSMPWIGLSTAFELGPYAGRPALPLHTAMLALFPSPS